MVKPEIQNYAAWQQILFWVAWLLLFIPGAFVAHSFMLVTALVSNGYHDMIDLTLLLIFGTGLLEMLLIGLYTLTRFCCYQGYSYKRLLSWLMLGILGIPLSVVIGSLYAYTQLRI